MGKKVRRKARSGHKEKRLSNPSPKSAPQENNHLRVETFDDRAAAEKEKKVCEHLEKAVDVGKVSSIIESSESIRCEGCREGALDRKASKGKGKHSKSSTCASDSKAGSKATWICLQCGHFSCGGVGLPNSPQSHAVRHARQSRHPLVIQAENPHLRWCFTCSMLIRGDKLEDTGERKDILSDIVKLLKKQSSKGTSLDVEDIWFGSASASVVSELKLESKDVDVVSGKDIYAVTGLVNLGNTCFFNSVLQNLLAVDMLREYLLKCDVGPMGGPLTSALKKIFIETSPKMGPRNVINPKALFGCICAKAPQFRGYQQQDSHELLRCLLDGLSTEDLCTKRSDSSSPENEGSSLRVGPTFVDVIFGGKLSSTVCCVECGHSSVVYEPFLDLSLPVPTKRPPSKKPQLGPPRTRKTKLPPKRGGSGRTRPKLNKDGDSGPTLMSGCEPSTSTSTESSLGASASLVCSSSGDVVGVNGLVCSNSAEQGYDNMRVVSQKGAQEADVLVPLDYLEPASHSGAQEEANGLSWLDYLEPVSLLDDKNLAAENNEDILVIHESGGNHDTVVSVQETSKSSGDLNLETESRVNGWGDEGPVQVQDNEILLLPYKEESATAMEGMKIDDADVSSSAVCDGEDTLGFEGLGDLFNEPEPEVEVGVSVAKTSEKHIGNGFLSSESDPDEVDDTNSPVSIETCLAHFIKPELLSGEHAWHCDNCSKLLQMRKKQVKAASNISNGNDECSSSEDLQVTSHPSSNCSTNVLATHNNGSNHRDENLNKLDTMQNNRCIDSHNHVPVERLSGLGEEHESGEDEEEEADSKSVKVMRNATKRILIDKAPPLLTIHLKRFAQDARGRLSKLNGHVGFNEYIDLGPFMDRRSREGEGEGDDCVYRLVGVVEHSGSMRGGHYVAYVRGGEWRKRVTKVQNSNTQGQCVWYYASDACVRESTLEEVLACEAYILFYQKVMS